MSAQTTYKFGTAMGAAGGIVDIAPLAIDSYLNGEDNGVMSFGVAVMLDSAKANHVKLAGSGFSASTFVGAVTNNRTTEYDLEGKTYLRKDKALGVMRFGRIYGRVVADDVATVEDGKPVYVVTSGENAGFFTGKASGNVLVNAMFRSGVDASTGVAVVEIFNDRNATA